jgi:membrane protein DedA with SNARE-associated domain
MMLRKNIIAGVLTLFFGLLVYAQKPTMAPKGDHKPIDFSRPENIIIYIVIPLVFLALYFLWRSKKRKERENNEGENNV